MPRPESSEEQRRRARYIQTTLKNALDSSSMGLEDLARESDVNRRTLDKFLLSESPNPSFFLVARIARALDVSLDDLATEALTTATPVKP